MAKTRQTLSNPGGKENERPICCLCKCTNVKLSSPQSWRDEKAQVLARSLGISTNQVVCRACRGDICRLIKNPGLVPRWKKENKQCCIPGCHNGSFAERNLLSADEMSTALGITIGPLCKQHYHTV